MPNKFGRIYSLQIATKDGDSIAITSPITLEFSVVRKAMAQANTASFVIYNLNESTRKKIFKDPYDFSDRRAIKFTAGYETPSLAGSFNPLASTSQNLAIAFEGEMRQAYSVRKKCDVRTEIECFDGGAALSQSFTSQNVPAGTDMTMLIKSLAKDLIGITKTTIGNVDNAKSTRSTSLFGNTSEMLKEVTGGQFFIDNQEGFVLGNNETIPGELNEISAETGLLETPRRAGTSIECLMLFEPRLRIGQAVDLVSAIEKNYSGTYKIMGLTHRGVISGAKGGACTTLVSLFAGTAAFSTVRNIGG